MTRRNRLQTMNAAVRTDVLEGKNARRQDLGRVHERPLRLDLIMLVLVLMGYAFTGCRGERPVTTLRLGHGLDVAHPVHRAMVHMADTLDALSDGTLHLALYPSQQLGTERECLELLQIGSLGLTKVSSSVLEGFAPAYQVFGLPYVFRDDAHRFAVLDGPIGRDILQSSIPQRLRGLTYYDAGSRSFYTLENPVRRPDDLKGMKIRTQESPLAIGMVSALGGAPTPIAWGELYTSLQQGVVDGAENNPPSFYLSRHYEVARYYSLDEHTSVPDVLLVSTSIWDRLTPQQRTWLQQAADASAVVQKHLWQEATAEAIQAVKAAGVTILRPDKAPFEAKVQDMYAPFRSDPTVGPLLSRIEALRDRSATPAPSNQDGSVEDRSRQAKIRPGEPKPRAPESDPFSNARASSTTVVAPDETFLHPR